MAPILSFIGAWRSTQAANAQAEGEAYTAQMNADIMNQNAALEARRQDRELADSRRRSNIAQGTTRAQAGLLGVFGGSSLDVLADLQGQAIFEQTSILDERIGARQNYLNQSASYTARAKNLLASRQSPWLNGGLAYTASAVDMITNVASLGMAGANSSGAVQQSMNPGAGSTSTFNYNTGTSTSDGWA